MTLLGPGYVHVYTGEGKGKTTAALGLALRAYGRGLSVLILQFLKGDTPTGESAAAGGMAPRLQIRPLGRPGVLSPADMDRRDRDLAAEGLETARRELASGAWDVVILDEVNTACALGLLPVGDLLDLMDVRPEGVELVLTGRGAPREVMDRADLVTEMKEVRHYFRKGVRARKGIEE